MPPSLRILLRKHIRLTHRDMRLGRLGNPFADEPPVWDAPGQGLRIGIVTEPFHHHWRYIAACRELNVSYQLVDSMGENWREKLRESACDAFLVWPSMGYRPYREWFDACLREMEETLGLTVYPAYQETRLYENKHRTAAWLQAHHIPHPATCVFTKESEALEHAATTPLPVVVKTGLGAMSSGVWIVRDRHHLIQWINQAFGKGLLADYRHKSERESGSILIQDYLPEVQEWRLVRIGDSYFGHKKGKAGEVHSGTGLVDWAPPEAKHLDFLHHVTETGGFRSMAVDTFETPDGKLWVNELQTVFSARASVDQMRVDGVAGRYVWDTGGGEQEAGEVKTDFEGRKGEETTEGPRSRSVDLRPHWKFEPGDFARNACCNLRVLDLLARVEPETPEP